MNTNITAEIEDLQIEELEEIDAPQGGKEFLLGLGAGALFTIAVLAFT